MADQAPPATMVAVDPDAVTQELLRAVQACAQGASMDSRGAEAKDLGAAALSFAQAIITLDPSRLQGGDTPEARAAAVPPQLPPTKDGDKDGVIGA